jgi:hypothetical protein
MLLIAVTSLTTGIAPVGHDASNRRHCCRNCIRVFTFQDYNTRVVVMGTTLLGLAAGLIGTFLVSAQSGPAQ